MTEPETQNALVNALRERPQWLQLEGYIQSFENMAVSCAESPELPYLQRLGVLQIKTIASVRLSVEKGDAEGAALLMAMVKDNDLSIEVELGRLNSLSEYPPESLEAGPEKIESLVNLSRDARLNQSQIKEKAEELYRESKSSETSRAASKRHEKTRILREYAEQLYGKLCREGKRKSRRDAARRILPSVEDKAEELGYRMGERFPQTVYEWLSQYDKK